MREGGSCARAAALAHLALVRVQAHVRGREPDLPARLAHDGLVVHLRLRGDFAKHHHHVGLGARLARHLQPATTQCVVLGGGAPAAAWHAGWGQCAGAGRGSGVLHAGGLHAACPQLWGPAAPGSPAPCSWRCGGGAMQPAAGARALGVCPPAHPGVGVLLQACVQDGIGHLQAAQQQRGWLLLSLRRGARGGRGGSGEACFCLRPRSACSPW